MLITFDLDEVLIVNPFGSGVFPYVRRHIAKAAAVDEADVRGAILAEARRRQRRGEMVAAYNWDDIVRHVSESFGVEWTMSIAALVERYCVRPHINLYPGAAELLAALKQQGHTLVALTNGYYKYQYPVLEALGIHRFFERIVTPEQVGAAKPQEEVFSAARSHYDLRHVHIGDHVIHDVWGANRVGAISVWMHHRLPGEWEQLTPRERAAEPFIETLVKRGIDADLCGAKCYPSLKVDDAKPQYVIAHLSEIKGIVDLLAS